MNRKRIIFAFIALWLAIVNCNWPSKQNTDGTSSNLSSEDLTATAAVAPLSLTTAIPSSTVETQGPTATLAASATPCVPSIAASSAINVRSGPGTVYPAVGSMVAGASAKVAGKSDDGTWWYIEFPAGAGGHAWVSGSVTTSSCIPATLASIAAPPTPLPPSGSCKDGYVHRLIRSSDKVCVPPASKAQADADNAAASSRLLTSTYGPDTCVEGYVWREAYSGDVVCVTGDVRSQAAADNSVAASRWVVGPYGPHTCIAGFVWREATSGDDVCVTGDVRAQAAADNAAANSRKAVNAYGADACAAGYVWREAFSSDHVCVTPAVKSQVAADNAAAPSHTWP